MAHGGSYLSVGHQFGFKKQTGWRSIRRVRDLIASLVPMFVTPPTSEDEIKSVVQGFSDLGGPIAFRNVLGAGDGSHVPFLPTRDQKKNAANRKGYISLIMHAVCDSHMRMWDINIGAYGSQSDSMVLQHSTLCKFCGLMLTTLLIILLASRPQPNFVRSC